MNARAFAPIYVALTTAGVVAVGMLFGPHWLKPLERIVACYDAGAIAMLIWLWSILLRSTTERTRARAGVQDPGRDAVFVVTLIAVAFGFVAAFEMLGHGPNDHAPKHDAAIYALGFGAVALGWLLIHTSFSFRYAHLYYRDRDRNKESDRGLKFPGDEEPNYADLAYFSFVIGMTFQVSDVQIVAKPIRRFVLAHGLVSFAYNTAILALVVNIVSGLLH
jgi:uncharacterized membrane protein